MATRWLDSFASYGSAAEMYLTYGGGGFSYSTSAGRYGTGACGATNTSHSLTKVFSSGASSWAVGFVMNLTAWSTAAFFRMLEGGVVHLSLSMSGNLLALNGPGGVLAYSNSERPISVNTDYAVEVKFVIGDSGTGSAEVWVNDEKVIDFTGDTRNGGTGVVNTFYWTQAGGGVSYYSELYINDTTGSAPNNDLWHGFCVRARKPSAAGNYAQWAPLSSTNVSNVDEDHTDSDTSYNSSATAGHKDSFQFSPVSPTSGTVCAINQRVVARKDDAGVRTIRTFQRQSGTDYPGTTQPLSTAYLAYGDVVEINPDTGVAFTLAEMQATSPEFGYELVA